MHQSLAELVFQSRAPKLMCGWSPDGRFLLYESESKLWALPLNGERKPIELFSLGGESRPDISPNTKWLAYQANESGRSEIYVQSFPPVGDKRQVSTAGGAEPYWRRDGKEMFYLAGNRLMVVDVKTNGQIFQSGSPRPLFEVRLEVEQRRSRYQVAADGQRFLVNVPLESALALPITVVTNWTTGLKK